MAINVKMLFMADVTEVAILRDFNEYNSLSIAKGTCKPKIVSRIESKKVSKSKL